MITIKTESFNTIAIACCVATIVYIDGFGALFLHLTDAGGYNPAVAVVIFSILVGLLVRIRRLPVWAANVLILDLLIISILACIDQSSALKLFRDYIYIVILLASFMLLRNAMKTGKIDSMLYVFFLSHLHHHPVSASWPGGWNEGLRWPVSGIYAFATDFCKRSDDFISHGEEFEIGKAMGCIIFLLCINFYILIWHEKSVIDSNDV